MNEYIKPFTRERLHDRHHLSHQQIDQWLGENRSKEFVQEKLNQLESVKKFLSVTDLLTQSGISFISLKGPLLSLRIYGDPAVRISNDIDLMVQLENLEAVVMLMTDNGYQFADGSVWPKKKIRRELLVSSCQHLSFFNKHLGCQVEIHWIFMNSLPMGKESVNKLVCNNLTSVSFAGRTFTVMNKEFELLYLMIHGAKHGWSWLKWLVDICDYPMDDLNIEHFNKLVHLFKAVRIINLTNYFLKKYFKKCLPVIGSKNSLTFLIRYAQKRIDGKIEESYSMREIIQTFRYKLLLFPDLSYKLKIISEVSISQKDVASHDFSSRIAYLLYRPYSLFIRGKVHV